MVSRVLNGVRRRAFAWGIGPYVVVCVTALLVAALGWFAYEKVVPRTFVSEADVMAEIARELPRGSSQTQIIDFLQRKNWSPNGPSKVTAPTWAGVPDGTLLITGFVPRAGRTWYCSYDLGLYFILDANGRFDRVVLDTANCIAP